MSETSNQRIKKIINDRLIRASDKSSVHAVYENIKIACGYIESLEAVPFGYRNIPIRIIEDLVDGVIDESEAVSQIKELLSAIPN